MLREPDTLLPTATSATLACPQSLTKTSRPDGPHPSLTLVLPAPYVVLDAVAQTLPLHSPISQAEGASL
jgi:hypothetical protein